MDFSRYITHNKYIHTLAVFLPFEINVCTGDLRHFMAMYVSAPYTTQEYRVGTRIKKQFKKREGTWYPLMLSFYRLLVFHSLSLHFFASLFTRMLHAVWASRTHIHTRILTICFNLNLKILFKSIVCLPRFIDVRIRK